MATAVAGLGFSVGFLLLPTPSGYLFMTLGFHKTMFIHAPTMAIHLFGAVLYTKNEQHGSETAEKPPDKEPLKATLLAMAANPKVNFTIFSSPHVMLNSCMMIKHLSLNVNILLIDFPGYFNRYGPTFLLVSSESLDLQHTPQYTWIT